MIDLYIAESTDLYLGMEGVVPKVLNLAQVDCFGQQHVSLNSLNTAKNNFHGVGPRNACVMRRWT